VRDPEIRCAICDHRTPDASRASQRLSWRGFEATTDNQCRPGFRTLFGNQEHRAVDWRVAHLSGDVIRVVSCGCDRGTATPDDTTAVVGVEVDWFLGLLLLL
jgi:hypothetical protein